MMRERRILPGTERRASARRSNRVCFTRIREEVRAMSKVVCIIRDTPIEKPQQEQFLLHIDR